MDIDVRVPTTADPRVIYALLRDGATWPEWSSLGSFELVREGATEREGVGAIRLYRTGRFRSYEEIVELVPDRRLSYVVAPGSNMPFRSYRADVDLDGSSIRWRSTFEPRWKATGWLIELMFRRFLRKTAEGLRAHASTSADDGVDRQAS
jgi:hypothetical protein